MGALFIPRSRTGWPQGLPARLAQPVAMTGAPTVSTTAFASPTLARAWFALSGSSSYSLASTPAGGLFSTSRTVVSGVSISYGPSLTVGTGTSATKNAGSLLQASFYHEGSNLEIGIQAASYGVIIRVDDQLVALNGAEIESAAIANPGQWFKLAFGSRALRRIDVIGGLFIGVRTDWADTISPAPIRGPRVMVLGDSFSTALTNGWPVWFSHALGWDDVWQHGVGGTGYVATNAGASRKFRDRVDSDVIPYAPDVLMVLGSLNDAGSAAATVQSEAAALVAQVKAALPNCLVVGGYNARGGIEKMNAAALDVMDAAKAGFTASGGVWLNPVEMPIAFNGGSAPASTTALNAYAAGRSGYVGVNPSVIGTGGVYMDSNLAGTTNLPQGGAVIELGAGATRERICVTGSGASSGKVGVAWDGTLQYAHPIGDPMVMRGPSYLTGRGYVGALTGFGNADLYVSADGTHPTTAGHKALGMVQATLLRNYLTQLK